MDYVQEQKFCLKIIEQDIAFLLLLIGFTSLRINKTCAKYNFTKELSILLWLFPIVTQTKKYEYCKDIVRLL